MIHLDHPEKLSFKERVLWHLFYRWHDNKFAVGMLKACPLCFWSGELNPHCPACKGKNRLNLADRVDYWLHKKEYWSEDGDE